MNWIYLSCISLPHKKTKSPTSDEAGLLHKEACSYLEITKRDVVSFNDPLIRRIYKPAGSSLTLIPA